MTKTCAKLEILPILLISLLLPVSAAASTYYVSNTATASTPCSVAEPCKPDSVWSKVNPGDTVIFKNGIYKGSSYMLTPSSESGTQSSRITVQAETDGGVLFDGEFARGPIKLDAKEYYTIEGFNACCSSTDKPVVSVRNGADNNIVRRVVAWDAGDSGLGVLDTNGSEDNLFEDCAGFGVGRKIFTGSSGNNATWRRTWSRWEGSTSEGPKMAYTLYYQATERTCENCLGTWDNGSMPSSYYLTDGYGEIASPVEFLDGCGELDQPRGAMGADRHDETDVINAAVYGSIFYLKGPTVGTLNCFATGTGGTDAILGLNIGIAIGRDDGLRVENVVGYIDPTNTGHNDIRAVSLGPGADVSPAGDLVAADITGIGKLANSIDGDWIKTDIEHATTVAGLSDSIYVGNGAHICYRYVNGVEQVGQKLWPWPMQSRILAATTYAAGAGHQHLMTLCDGTSCSPQLVTDPHAIADVMADIVTMFGPIPAACLEGGSGGDPDEPPPPPEVWRTDKEE